MIIVNIVSYAYLLNIYPGCNDVLKAGESTSAEQMQQCQVVVATLLWNLALMALGGIMTIGGIVGFLWIWTGKKDNYASWKRKFKK